MTTDVRNRAQRLHQSIRKALLNEWDPVGISEFPQAHNEYNSYVPAIYKMLVSKKSKHEIFNYLWWIETEHMGLTGDRQATEIFADRLMRIPSDVDQTEGACDDMKKGEIQLALSSEEALVFFEWLSRYNRGENTRIEDQAEQQVLSDIEAMLESTLTEPFAGNYEELLAKARAKVRDLEG